MQQKKMKCIQAKGYLYDVMDDVQRFNAIRLIVCTPEWFVPTMATHLFYEFLRKEARRVKGRWRYEARDGQG